MRIAVAGPNLRDQSKGTFHVHAADCADLRRTSDEPEYANADVFEAESLVEVCDRFYPPAEFECESGDYVDDFHVFPCCKELS